MVIEPLPVIILLYFLEEIQAGGLYHGANIQPGLQNALSERCESLQKIILSAGRYFYFRIICHGYGAPFPFIIAFDTGQVDEMGIVHPVKIMLRQQLLELFQCPGNSELVAIRQEYGGVVDVTLTTDNLLDREELQALNGRYADPPR